MIKGLGVDLVENNRIENLLRKWGDSFFNKLFLPEEIEYCSGKKNLPACFAARIACKEAVFKAFGTGWNSNIGWKDIKIVKTLHGEPQIEFFGGAQDYWDKKGFVNLKVSLSHTDSYSIAVVVIEG